MGNFRDAVDTYQMLIKRFPKNELTPDCYLKIAESFCQQSLYEFQNPDILALAELNVRKFKEEFPRDEKTETADGYVCRIKEMYAKGLCDVGLFYERMGQPEAAIIYYQSSIEEFPDTNVAKYCRRRLACLGRPFEDEEGPSDVPASPDEEGTPEVNNELYQNEINTDLNAVPFENSEPSRESYGEVCQEKYYSENRAYEELEPSMYQEQLANYQEQPINWDLYNQENRIFVDPEPSFSHEHGANDQELPVNWKEYNPENQVSEDPLYEEKTAHYQEQPSDWCEQPENGIYDGSMPFNIREQSANDLEPSLNWNEYYPENGVFDESGPFRFQEESSNWNENYPENPVFGKSEPFSLQEQPAIYQEQPSDWCEYDPDNSYYGESESFEEQPANYQPSNWFEHDPEPYFDAGRIYQDQPANFHEQPTEWSEFYPPYPSCAPVDLDYDIHTNAVQEEIEAAPAPIYLHYSLLKKRQQVQKCQERRRR
jgi:hypothetical protein